MTLLQPAVNQSAYLKAGFMGFAGSGKTYTATLLALEIAQRLGDKKPVAFFDTEAGSDYMIPRFEKAGVQLLVVKSRSFKDLLTFCTEAEQVASVAIVDSVSHVWTDLMEACKKRFRTQRLEFHHWGPIKSEWGQFTDAFLNSQLHMIVCGRAGHQYEYQDRDDGSGKKELITVGTKMRAESEFGFEPSLLIEMERVSTGGGDTASYSRRAHVIKDRWDVIDGRTFENPTPADFWPAIEPLNIGGEQKAVAAGSDSAELFDDPDTSRYEYKRQCEIVAEEIKALFMRLGLDGTAAGVKKERVQILEDTFGTASWTAITSMSLDELQGGYQALLSRLDPQPPEDAADEADPF